jgi:hypothetical protein
VKENLGAPEHCKPNQHREKEELASRVRELEHDN